MARQDHLYVNLDKGLLEVVDSYVSVIFSNGAKVYANRKDFVTKSIQAQIEKEKKRNPNLEKTVENSKALKQFAIGTGGNRINVPQ